MLSKVKRVVDIITGMFIGACVYMGAYRESCHDFGHFILGFIMAFIARHPPLLPPVLVHVIVFLVTSYYVIYQSMERENTGDLIVDYITYALGLIAGILLF